jgi:hypothetical protein
MRVCHTIYHHTASLHIHFNEDTASGNEVQKLFIQLSPTEIMALVTNAFRSSPVQINNHFNLLRSINSILLNFKHPQSEDVRLTRKGVFCSPIFIFPDELSNGTLILDFGRITLSNNSIMPRHSSQGLVLDETECLHVIIEGSQVLYVYYLEVRVTIM